MTKYFLKPDICSTLTFVLQVTLSDLYIVMLHNHIMSVSLKTGFMLQNSKQMTTLGCKNYTFTVGRRVQEKVFGKKKGVGRMGILK